MPKCYGCGQVGHIQRHCPNKASSTDPKPSTSTSTNPSESKTIVCSFCAKSGHVVDNCFTRQNIEKRKKINFCSSGREIKREKIKIDGLPEYLGTIDTGADISLIAERHLPKFEYKSFPCNLSLASIISGSLVVKKEFRATVEICDVTTDLLFHVVPNSVLEDDVIIGRNLYDDPEISTVTDQEGTRVVRTKISRVFRIIPCDNEEPLDVPDEHRLKLTNLLALFTSLIPKGGLLPEVNNAHIEIKLRDDYVVNRNPYRLAAIERKIVREIINDLMTNNIIRESTSPFASPIVLVRKKEGKYRMCA